MILCLVLSATKPPTFMMNARITNATWAKMCKFTQICSNRFHDIGPIAKSICNFFLHFASEEILLQNKHIRDRYNNRREIVKFPIAHK